jgi:Acetone carboxylase, gamma subunit
MSYGVVLTTGAEVDGAATSRKRQEMFSARIGAEVPQNPVAPVGARPVGDSLALLGDRFVCGRCGSDAGPSAGNFKEHVATRSGPTADIAPGFAGGDASMAAKVEFREYFCRGCGVRFDTEIAAVQDPPLWDLRLSP